MLFKTKKNILTTFGELPGARAGFAAFYSAYMQCEEALASQKTYSENELEKWCRVLDTLLTLSLQVHVSVDVGSKLCQHVLACGRRYIAFDYESTRDLIHKLCEICRANRLDNEILSFAGTAPPDRCPPAIACMIFGQLGPGSPAAVRFYKKLWKTTDGQQIVMENAASGIERMFPTAFAEPGYSQNEELLSWVASEFIQTHPWRRIAEFMLALWRGALRVQRPDDLDGYYNEFRRMRTPLGNVVAFAIACVCAKIEGLNGQDANRQQLIPWAGIYEPVIKGFLDSLNSSYPDLGRLSVNQPQQYNYPSALYQFVMVAFAFYASKKFKNFNSRKAFKEITGPWRVWSDQFSHKEIPYQINPDMEHYKKLLLSEVISSQVKEDVAPWVIEFTYYKEGDERARAMMNELPVHCRKMAQKRLDALTGVQAPEYENAADLTVNDLLCMIRYGVVKRDPFPLRAVRDNQRFVELNEYERIFCEQALNVMDERFSAAGELASLGKIGEHGLPLACYLAGYAAFENHSINEAVSYLADGCAKAPSMRKWKELLAQVYVCAGRNDDALGLLDSMKQSFTKDASELYGWILFSEMFPTVESLVAPALDPKRLHRNNSYQQLRMIGGYCQIGSPIHRMIEGLLNAADHPDAPPTDDEYPDFAVLWKRLRCAITAQDPDNFWHQINSISSMNIPSGQGIVRNAASRFLLSYTKNRELGRDELTKMLDLIGIGMEEYFEAKLRDAIEKNTPASVVKAEFSEYYTESHTVFGLVILYAAIEAREYETALGIIEKNYADDHSAEIALCKIVCLIRMKALDRVEQCITAYSNDGKQKNAGALALLLLQLLIVSNTGDLRTLVQQASANDQDLSGLPPAFKAHLLRRLLAIIAKAPDGEFVASVAPLFDPAAMGIIRIAGSPYGELVSSLDKIDATDEWGLFILRKVLWMFFDEVKKNGESMQLVAVMTDKVLPFVTKNSIRIAPEELSALENIARLVEGYDTTITSLKGILLIQDVEEIAGLSNTLLRAMEFPVDPAAFDRAAKTYLDLQHEDALDRHWLFTGVVSCWIEYIEQQKSIVKSCEQMLQWLTIARMNLLCNEGFGEWVLEKRRQLPQQDQFLEPFMQFIGQPGEQTAPLFKWMASLYFEQISVFFNMNKVPQAKRYSDIVHQLCSSPQQYLKMREIPDEGLDQNALAAVQHCAIEGVEKWLNDTTGNLENSMLPNEEIKKDYRFDYRKGLDHIKKILTIFPDNKRLLRLGLYYANQWNEDVMKIGKDSEKERKMVVDNITEFSNNFADSLAPLCEKGKEHEHELENQCLAKHYYYKAISENQSNPGTYVERILEWEPGHSEVFYFYRSKLQDEYEECFKEVDTTMNDFQNGSIGKSTTKKRLEGYKTRFQAMKSRMENLHKVVPKTNDVFSKIEQDLSQLRKNIDQITTIKQQLG